MRMIDADALMNTIIQKSYTVTDYWNSRDAGMFLVGIEQAINEQPTIEERKTGTWCLTPDGRLVCSNCYNNPTNRIIVDGSLIYDMTPIRKRMKFCPSCGASMTEEKYDEIN